MTPMKMKLPQYLYLLIIYSLVAPGSSLSPHSTRKSLVHASLFSHDRPQQLHSSFPLALSSLKNDNKEKESVSLLEKISASFSQRAATKVNSKMMHTSSAKVARQNMQFFTLLRVSIPSILAGVLATLAFPSLALGLVRLVSEQGALTVLSTDSSQFVQNFLTVAGLLFSILVGQTYYFMYQQQENVYYALFNEVTEAKSLLEQVALVCQGRSMYTRCLDSISKYVKDDLKQLQADPAVLLSARPADDPLESLMYMTSVGVPGTVYETVRSLRQARAARLGALQRKLPAAHMWLLWILAAIELVSFPLLGAGTQIIGGYKILTVEGLLFGVMTSGIVMTLKVVGELWRPAGGAYNVDAVLSVMVSGLEEELQARTNGPKKYTSNMEQPSKPESLPIRQQGGDILQAGKKVYKWARGKRRRG